jgi:hypothetical protein
MGPRSLALALCVAAGLAAPDARAQTSTSPNEVEAKVKGNVQDRGDVWVLKFRFYTPRMVTVDVPGRGRRVCWYLLYDVANPDPKEPHRFIPDFELVSHDAGRERKVFHDQVLPAAQKAIQQIEDPTGHLDIKNSVTIASQPLPAARPDAVPRWHTGVAIWDDVDPDTNTFSVFVSGLSNGWSVDDKEVVRRKTLQLNFKRAADRSSTDARAIRFIRPEQWEYVAVPLSKAPAREGKNASPAEEKKPDDGPNPTIKPPSPKTPKG